MFQIYFEQKNNLALNLVNSNYILLSVKNRTNCSSIDVFSKNYQLKEVESNIFLGLMVDLKLHWKNNHIPMSVFCIKLNSTVKNFEIM